MHSVSRNGGISADSWTQNAPNGAKMHSVSTVIRGRSEAAKQAGAGGCRRGGFYPYLCIFAK